MFNKLIDFKIVVISRQLLANFIQGLTQKIFVSAESSNLCRVCLREAADGIFNILFSDLNVRIH